MSASIIIKGVSLFTRRIQALLSSKNKDIVSVLRKIRVKDFKIDRDTKALFILHLVDLDKLCNSVLLSVFKNVYKDLTVADIYLIEDIAASVSNMLPKRYSRIQSPLIRRLFDEVEYEEIYDNIHPLSKDEIVELGQVLLDICVDSFKDVLVRFEEVDKHIRVKCIKLHADISSKLLSNFINPLSIPMLCKPNIWGFPVRPTCGGYITKLYIKTIKREEIISKDIKRRIHEKGSKLQVNAINYINNQIFVINKDMLNFLIDE
jgi:hypothetical protein